MSKGNFVLRHHQNGVEFFTLENTGESGMSAHGIARLCGVYPKLVEEIIDK